MASIVIPPLKSPTRKPLHYPFPHPISIHPSCVLALFPIRDDKWFDFSGKANHGTLKGPSWTAKGRHGPALIFDGLDDYVDCPHATSLNLTGNFTLEAWIKRDSTQPDTWAIVFAKESNYILYSRSNGQITFEFKNAAGTWVSLSTTVAISAGEWHHIVATAEPTTNTIVKIYVDGALSREGTLTGVPQTNTYALRVGMAWYADYHFKGLIDEARGYKAALSALELKSLYELGLGVK